MREDGDNMMKLKEDNGYIFDLRELYAEKDRLLKVIHDLENEKQYEQLCLVQKEYIELLGNIHKIETVKMDATYARQYNMEALKNGSFEDHLTGIFNRRYLQRVMNHYRKDHKVACLIVDIDNFKTINDRFGHLFGDVVLREVVETMRNSLFLRDIFCRYGGDEFVVLVYEQDLTKVVELAEELRCNIEALDLRYEGQPINVTLSIGVADNHKHKPKDAQDLLHLADLGLYRAKKNGRNQVCVYEY